MKVWGYLLMGITLPFAWALGHAIGMFQQTGDGRWFLTIVGAPIMGAMILWLGITFVRADT